MADIADIGFRANTRELVDAKIKLDALKPAAGRAERAAAALEKATGSLANAALKAARGELDKANAVLKAAKASDTATKADIAAASATVKQERAALAAAKAVSSSTQADNAAAAAKRKLAAATDLAAVAQQRQNANQNIPSGRVPSIPQDDPLKPLNQGLGAMRANVGNIAAQFQDVGVTAAMGMNPLLIALQQGTQLSAVFASMRPAEAVAALATAFRSIVSVVAIATIGLVAVAAALIQFVDWTAVAQSGLNALASGIQTIGPYAIAAGAALALAFAPQIAVAIWGITTAIVSGLIGAISALALSLVALVGAIPLLIGVAIGAVFYFSDTIKQVFGVDVVGYAKFAVNYIIGSFVAAYNDIKFLWANFPDIIGAAAIGAANYVINAVNDMIKASVQGYNQLVMTANAIGSKLGFDPIALSDTKTVGFDLIVNDAATRLASAVKDRNVQLQKDLSKDYLGAIGGAVTDATKAAADKLRSFSSGLGATDAAKGPKAGAGPKAPKSDAEKFEDIVSGAERSIASLQAQKDAIGLTAEAAARLKYETQLLNDAQQKNINLTPEQKTKLEQLASSMAKLEVETARAKEALDFSKSAFKGFINDIAQGLESGKSFWQSFADAGLNALDKLVDKMLNDVIDAIFSVQEAGSGGGGGMGGMLGGLLQGAGDFIAGIFGFAKGGAFPGGISGHSNSVVSQPTMFAFASGAGVMGEAGPEAIMPLSRMPNGDLGVQAASNAGSTSKASNDNANVLTVNVNVSGANGNKEIKEMVMEGVSSGLEAFNLNVLPARVNQINGDSRVR